MSVSRKIPSHIVSVIVHHAKEASSWSELAELLNINGVMRVGGLPWSSQSIARTCENLGIVVNLDLPAPSKGKESKKKTNRLKDKPVESVIINASSLHEAIAQLNSSGSRTLSRNPWTLSSLANFIMENDISVPYSLTISCPQLHPAPELVSRVSEILEVCRNVPSAVKQLNQAGICDPNGVLWRATTLSWFINRCISNNGRGNQGRIVPEQIQDGLFWLNDLQFAAIQPHFPKQRRSTTADDRRIVSGIVYVLKNKDSWWSESHQVYGAMKGLDSRFRAWAKQGVWASIFHALEAAGGPPAHVLLESRTMKALATGKDIGLTVRATDERIVALEPTIRALVESQPGISVTGILERLEATQGLKVSHSTITRLLDRHGIVVATRRAALKKAPGE